MSKLMYIVVSLAISGRNNKIYRKGDIVTEGKFPEGRLKQLEKEGHVKRVESEEDSADSENDIVLGDDLADLQPEITQKEESETETEKDDTEKDSADSENDSRETTIDSISAKELKRRLKDLGINYDKDSSKQELWQLWLIHKA